MRRQVALVVIWMLAIACLVVAIGMQVRAHRRADPVQALRRMLPWVPEDLASQATVIGRSPTGCLQIAWRGKPAEVRHFAARNAMQELTTPLYGMAPAQRWSLVAPRQAGVLVHLLLPSDGSPALITATGCAP